MGVRMKSKPQSNASPVCHISFLFDVPSIFIPSFYFFKNALNKSIGSGRNVVVLCSLAISRIV